MYAKLGSNKKVVDKKETSTDNNEETVEQKLLRYRSMNNVKFCIEVFQIFEFMKVKF